MTNLLRKWMEVLGYWVETLIHFFQKIKNKKFNSSQPLKTSSPKQLAVSEEKLKKILEEAECKEIISLIPRHLEGKKVLYITHSSLRIWDFFEKKSVSLLVDFDLSASYKNLKLGFETPPNLHRLKGSMIQAPFRDKSFDFIFLLGGSNLKNNPILWIKEISRILKEDAKIIFSLPHPYLEYQLSPELGFKHRTDQYFAILRKAGIYIEDMKEVFQQSSKKNQETEKPLLLFFKGIRLRKIEGVSKSK